MLKEKEQDILPEIVKLRHYFHEYPELSNQEFKTTKKIIEILNKWDIPVVPSKLNTGLLAQIKGDYPGPTIALRADIDALPIEEKTNLSYKSQNTGVMHACGHDIHLSSLLGAAYLLNQHKEKINGTIDLLFQPAEEVGHGGDQVIEKNVLKGVDAIVGFHNMPTLKPGIIAMKKGPLMAGCYHFVITLHGAGTHAAQPQEGTDVVVTQAAIISQLQTIVSRNNNPFHSVVVSVTKVNAGETWNVLPEMAVLEGTVRTFYDEDTELVKRRLFKIVNDISSAFNQKADIDWTTGAHPVNNDEKITSIVKNGLSLEVEKPVETMTAEDFATFEQIIPGTFAFIGSNGDPQAVGVHDPHYIGSDETIQTAIKYFVESAYSLLSQLK